MEDHHNLHDMNKYKSQWVEDHAIYMEWIIIKANEWKTHVI